MGTPLLNAPQSAILGMHGIFKRPVVINNEVIIRPMMYDSPRLYHCLFRLDLNSMFTVRELLLYSWSSPGQSAWEIFLCLIYFFLRRYVALTYDHRIIDGKDAVTFLKDIKQGVEDPSRLLLEL